MRSAGISQKTKYISTTNTESMLFHKGSGKGKLKTKWETAF